VRARWRDRVFALQLGVMNSTASVGGETGSGRGYNAPERIARQSARHRRSGRADRDYGRDCSGSARLTHAKRRVSYGAPVYRRTFRFAALDLR